MTTWGRYLAMAANASSPLDMVAIGNRGLAGRLVVRLDSFVLLLAVVGGRDAQGLSQDAMARADLDSAASDNA